MGLLRVVLVIALVLLVAGQVGAGCIGWIKANCHVGDVVEACGVVTAEFADCIYIQDEDRSAGIRVRGYQGFVGTFYVFAIGMPSAGMLVGAGADGEMELMFLPGTMVASIPASELSPLMFANRCLGGGCITAAGEGQQGTCGGCGVNTIGLLVKTCGRVTEANEAERWFYLDDGSARCKCGNHRGVRVDYSTGNGGHPEVGGYTCVTGICGAVSLCGKLHPVVRLRP